MMSSGQVAAPGTAPQLGPRYTHEQIIRVITGIMLCILLAALDQTVVVPAVPVIAGEMGAFGHLSWIVTAYLLTSTAATPIYGKLSDIYGRRRLLLGALVVFIAASLCCGFARTVAQLILARALQGLGGAGLMSMAQAAIADVVSPRERGRYQGYMAGAWGVASIAGPVVGGYVTQHLSWRWLFWANLPLGLVAIALCQRGLTLLPVRGIRARIDGAGAGLLIAAVTAWLLVLSWGGIEFPWASAPVLGLAALGVICIAVLIPVERRARDPILPPRLFSYSVFLGGVAVAFCVSLALLGATFLLPLWFQLAVGVPPARSGVLVMPFLAANTAGAYTAGQIARKIGRTKGIVLPSLCLCVLGFAGLGRVGTGTPEVLVLLATVVLGVGIGGVMPSVLVQVQNAAEHGDVGAATGSLLFLRSMGGAFGTTVTGALLAARFNAGLRAVGAGEVSLAALQGGGAGALGGLGADKLDAARAALVSGFHLAFWACAGVVLLALAIAGVTRDVPLRSTEIPREMGH